jgi:Glyoxalase-like domain
MTRARPDGVVLHWRLTSGQRPGDGLVPFLIDWGESEHPSSSAPAGCTLVSLRGEHPEPGRIAAWLAALDLDLPLAAGPRPALYAELDTPRGRVMLS